MTIKIGVHGASGKMGLSVLEAISRQNNKFSLAARFTKKEGVSLNDFCNLSDVIIDFSVPDALPDLLEAVLSANKKIVIGTTGLSAKHMQMIVESSKHISIIYAPNTSLSANLLVKIASQLAKILPTYDAEIVDLHHRSKKDAPSGTAIAIGSSIAEARGQLFEEKAVLSRVGHKERQTGDIGISSLRCGNIYGEHEVLFVGENEAVTIGAKSFNRNVFADGALAAASWLNSKDAGLYSMQDVLGL